MQRDYPLYIQVKQKLEDSILSGKFTLGQEIPSIRALAVDFQVNPNTVQRALSLLREEELLYLSSHRRFSVTRDTLLISRCKERKAQLLVSQLRESLSTLGYGRNEILDELISTVGVAG